MRVLAVGLGAILVASLAIGAVGAVADRPGSAAVVAGVVAAAAPGDRSAPGTRGRAAVGVVSAGDTAFRWSLGSRVHTWNGGDVTITGAFVRADSTSTGAVLATVPLGSKGTLRGGPVLAADGGQRWKVAWDGAATGWSRQIYLVLDSTPPPPVPVATTVTLNQSVVELVGQRTPVLATVRDQFGMVQPFPVTWASRSPAIATVDTVGVVLGVAPGLDTITATSGAARGQTLALIQAATVPPIVVLPRVVALRNLATGATIPMGNYLQATAQPVDSAGDVLGNVVTWTVADSSIVKVILPWGSVSQAAEVVALAPGSTTVTASVGPVTASVAVTVTAADTTQVSWSVGGVQVPSLPALRHFTFPVLLTLYNRPCYTVHFTAPGTDSVVAITVACIRPP